MADESQPAQESTAEPTPVVVVDPPPKRSIEDRIQSALEPEKAPEEQAVEQPEATEQPPEVAVTEQPEEQPAEQDDIAEVSTLGDLAEHLGVEVSELYNVAIPVDIEGERREITLSEYKDAYQSKEKLAKAQKEAQDAREQMAAEAESARIQTERAILQAAKLTEQAEKRLIDEFGNEAYWNQLHEEDPGLWAAKRQELQERQRQVDTAKNEVEAAFREHVEKQQAVAMEQTQEQIARERDRLFAAIPEWQNQDTMKQEIAELRGYLSDSGFKAEEVDSVYDHRLILMLRKARAFDQQNSKIEVAKKRVVKIGKKTTTPGTANTAETARQDDAALRSQNLRKSGKVEDAAAIIAARMRR